MRFQKYSRMHLERKGELRLKSTIMGVPRLNLKTINHERVNDQVHQVLKEQIISGTLVPGQRLDVGLMAGRLGVSRTPIKDALQRLATQGLITIHARRGTFVTKISPRDVHETF